jgi:excisionase family DNA binding protein
MIECDDGNGAQPLDEEAIDSRSAAAFLHIHYKTIERMARTGWIPATKVGKKWQFLRSLLSEWRKNQMYLNLNTDHPSTNNKRKENEKQ